MDPRTKRWLETFFGDKAKDIKNPAKLYSFGEPLPFTIKQMEDGEDFFIEGYASTKSPDRGGDIVLPEAFEEAMAEYETNPIVFYMHSWWVYPVGKMVDWKIDEDGLWVRDYVSMTAATERKLISEGILRALSIGFDPLEIEYVNKGQPTQQRVIKKLRLYEHSIVNIPMNVESLFEQAKAKGLKIKDFNLNQPGPEAQEEEREMFKLFVKMFDHSDGRGGSGVTIDEVKSVVKTSMDGVTGKLEEIGHTLTAIQEGAKSAVTKAELNEFREKAKQDLLEANKKWWEEQVPDRKHRFDPSQALLVKDITSPRSFKSAIFARPAAEVADDFGFKEERIKRFQKLHDDILILHFAMMAGNASYRQDPDITQLKMFHRYMSQISEFQKALNTSIAGSGLEWVPTEWSSDLLERIEVERRIAKFFPRFPQPTASYPWPIRGAKPKVYIKSEATADYPAGMSLCTPGTAKITFTAKGLAGGVAWSDEMDEDSIAPVLETVRADLVSAFVDAEEDIIINGDNSATHQDSDVAALPANDHRKLLKGLRILCNSGAKYDVTTGTTAFAGSDVLEVLKKGGKYAVNPMKTFIVTSVDAYFDMMGFSEVKTIEVWGQNATYLRGALTAFLGRPLFPSEFVRQDLNATGVYDGTTTDYTILLHVHGDSFKIGDRRQVTIEIDKDIKSGLYYLVGTARWDFQKMVASADNPVSLGYKI